MEYLIGIDLGTTNSLCAVFKDGEPLLIPNSLGKLLTPSVVGILDGNLIVGETAREMRITRPELTYSCFKRLMGTNETVKIAGETFSSIELSSLVLKSLKTDAESFLGSEVKEAVITVPAYFNDNQRKATVRAGQLAGLNVRRVINEPTSAALTYGFHDQDADKKLLVVDLGGGTFDVTLMEIFEGSLEIMGTAGESFLGGEDFTNAIVNWCLKQKNYNFETVEFKYPELLSRLTKECEQAKRTVQENSEAVINFPTEDGKKGEEELMLSPDQFSEIVSTLMKRLEKPLLRVLSDTDILPDEIDDIILVGGATRMSLVSDFIKKIFKKDPLCTFDPDHVVALGASIQAALIKDDSAVEDMVLTDVCPFTLGVEIVKTFGKQEVRGYYLPIIHRNTTIPVSKEDCVSTMYPNQKEILVQVYQGESRRTKDNLKLGELRVTGIPPGPKGQDVYIRFSYDLNGILDVEAYVPSTGKKFNTVLTNHVSGLDEKELEKCIKKLQEFKFFPRDESENLHLLKFAERISGEISVYERESFEMVVDAFERAMSDCEKDYFEEAKSSLLNYLAKLGYKFDPRGNR